MIAAVRFQNFKALRSTRLRLEPFNLVLGPNGSGKTSLIQSFLLLRRLAGQGDIRTTVPESTLGSAPRLEYAFCPPFESITVHAHCVREEFVCDTLAVSRPEGEAGERLWQQLREHLLGIRGYHIDPAAMSRPSPMAAADELAPDGSNIAAVLANWKRRAPDALAGLEAEFRRIAPEFYTLEFPALGNDSVGLLARVDGEAVPAENLSQGTLHLLAVLTLAFNPQPPPLLCLEEADRGIHPRMLRVVRDALYRLSHPRDAGLTRPPAQVVATTHSPYLLDQYREHPEEIVLASKVGRAATFERLSDRADLIEMMRDAHLGDLWYSGILGGVPGEL